MTLRARLGGAPMLQPLRRRDFALLVGGSVVSLGLTFVLMGVFELGQVIWTTMLQQLVPRELLGRVSSLDGLTSTGLVPISFALTGPVADTIGSETTIIVAGLAGAALFFALLFVPGVRDPERTANGLNPAEAAISRAARDPFVTCA